MALTAKEQEELARLSAKFEPPATANPQTPALAPGQPEKVSSGEAALQGFGQGASFGYLPELQALAEPAITAALNVPQQMMGGQPVPMPEESLSARIARWRGREQGIRQEKPGAYMAGALPGAVATGVATSGLPVVGAAGSGLSGAIKAGAIQGALTNPEKDYTDLGAQLKARASQGVEGGALGAAGHAVGSALSSLPGKLQSLKEGMAIYQMGANKPAVRKLIQQDKVPGLTAFMGEEGLIKPGTTVDDVVKKTSAIMDQTGNEIENTYNKAVQAANKVATPEQLSQLAPFQINPDTLAQEFADVAKQKAKGMAGGQQSLQFVNGELNNLKSLGDTATIEDLFKYRKSLDNLINYDKTLADSPPNQQMLRNLRDFVKTKIDKHIEVLDKIFQTKDTEALKALNDTYSKAATINAVSENAVAGNKAKMLLGLPETLVGQAAVGTVAGGANYAQDHNPAESLAKGLAAALAYKGIRKYGPGVGYTAASALQKAAVPAAQVANQIPFQQSGKLISPWLLRNNGGSR